MNVPNDQTVIITMTYGEARGLLNAMLRGHVVFGLSSIEAMAAVKSAVTRIEAAYSCDPFFTPPADGGEGAA